MVNKNAANTHTAAQGDHVLRATGAVQQACAGAAMCATVEGTLDYDVLLGFFLLTRFGFCRFSVFALMTVNRSIWKRTYGGQVDTRT